MKLDPVLVAVAALLVTVLLAIVGWVIMAWKNAVQKNTTTVKTADVLEQFEKDLEQNNKRIDDLRDENNRVREAMTNRLNAHDNFFKAVELRLNDLGHMEKTVQDVCRDIRAMNEKMDDRAKDVDQQFREQNKLLNSIHLLASKNQSEK